MIDFLTKFEQDPSFRMIDELWKTAAENNLHKSVMYFGNLSLDLRNQAKQKILPGSTTLLQNLSISGFYTGDARDRLLGNWAADQLSVNKEIPSYTRDLARKNLIFYTRKIQTDQQIQLLYPNIDWNVTNPSIVTWKNSLWMIQRSVNYTIDEQGRYNTGPRDPIITKNYLVQLDNDYNIVNTYSIGGPHKWLKPIWNLVLGFEDCRLFVVNNELWCSATIREQHTEGLCQMALMKLHLTAKKCYFETPTIMPSPSPDKHQKNWMPFAKSSSPLFVYCCDPVVILDDKNNIHAKQKTNIAVENFRGGSQVIDFEYGLLAVIHESIELDNGLRDYSHRFVYFDKECRINKISSRFKLNGHRIEFVAGMTLHPTKNQLILSHGVNDSQSWLSVISTDLVKSILIPVP